MDGEPLYWYARNNKPLPRPIEARPCTVHRLDLTSWTPGGEHDFKWPTEHLTEEEREVRKRVGELVEKAGVKGPQEGEVTKSKEAEKVLVDENGPVPAQLVEAESGAAAGDKRRREDDASPTDPKRARRDTDAEEAPSPARDADALEADQSSSLVFEISMTVSSGTYVRTIAQYVSSLQLHMPCMTSSAPQRYWPRRRLRCPRRDSPAHAAGRLLARRLHRLVRLREGFLGRIRRPSGRRRCRREGRRGLTTMGKGAREQDETAAVISPRQGVGKSSRCARIARRAATYTN